MLIAGKHAVRVDPAKVKAIRNCAEQNILRELREFTGLIKFFRRFVKDILELSKAFTDLKRKKTEYSPEKTLVIWLLKK